MARSIAAEHLSPGAPEIHIALPMQLVPELAHAAYDEGAARIGAELERGRDVAVLCVGDPFLYGSFAQLFERLGERYRTEVVPGVASFTAAAAAARTPLVGRSETLAVLPATLPRDALATHLAGADGVAILKLGRHLAKVRTVLAELGLLERAIYVEHASTADERVVRLADLAIDEAPYFALLLLPPDAVNVSARAAIVLLGPSGLEVAKRIAAAIPDAELHGPSVTNVGGTRPAPLPGFRLDAARSVCRRAADRGAVLERDRDPDPGAAARGQAKRAACGRGRRGRQRRRAAAWAGITAPTGWRGASPPRSVVRPRSRPQATPASNSRSTTRRRAGACTTPRRPSRSSARCSRAATSL